jgi:uncharacterized protein (UPF0335 family)
MLATCPQCDHEDKIDSLRTELSATRLRLEEVETERDNAMEHNQHMLEVAKANGFDCLTDAIVAGKKSENYKSLLKLAHEWGANGTKGYSASCAENFQRAVEHILSNVQGERPMEAK